MIEVQLTGWEDVQRMLRELPEKLMKKAIREGIRKASAPIVQMARAKAPVGKSEQYWVDKDHRPGTLQRAIVRASVTRYKGTILSGGVKITHGKYKSGKKKGQYVRNDAYYWYWVHRGHRVVLPSKSERYVDNSGKSRRGHYVRHVPANPFLTETFAANSNRSIDLVRDEIAAAIKNIQARGVNA